MFGKNYRIGLTALGLSLLAILLALFPACLMQQRIIKDIEPTCLDKQILLADGSEKRRNCLTETKQCATEQKSFDWRLRCCNLITLVVAVAAISTAIYSWRKEQANEFCLFSIFSSLIAVSWQHVDMVFSVSMALLLFIILTARLN
jgi:hypothetical protein